MFNIQYVIQTVLGYFLVQFYDKIFFPLLHLVIQ